MLDLIRASGAETSIPSTSQRTVRRSVDMAIYRQRNQVERFFRRLKHFRRVATRFDKLARNFLAAVLLASTRLWLRTYESTSWPNRSRISRRVVGHRRSHETKLREGQFFNRQIRRASREAADGAQGPDRPTAA
jgi:Transposase DDE domain